MNSHVTEYSVTDDLREVYSDNPGFSEAVIRENPDAKVVNWIRYDIHRRNDGVIEIMSTPTQTAWVYPDKDLILDGIVIHTGY